MKLHLLGTVEQVNVLPFQRYIYHLYNASKENKLYNMNYMYSPKFQRDLRSFNNM